MDAKKAWALHALVALCYIQKKYIVKESVLSFRITNHTPSPNSHICVTKLLLVEDVTRFIESLKCKNRTKGKGTYWLLLLSDRQTFFRARLSLYCCWLMCEDFLHWKLVGFAKKIKSSAAAKELQGEKVCNLALEEDKNTSFIWCAKKPLGVLQVLVEKASLKITVMTGRPVYHRKLCVRKTIQLFALCVCLYKRWNSSEC